MDIIVAETAVDDCTTTSSLTEGSGTAVEETGNSRTFTLSDNGTLDFVNTFESQEVIAPTNFSTRHSPWILMLLFGLMLLIGGMGVIRRRGRGNDPDDSGPAACFIRKEGTCLRHSEPNRHSVPEQTCGEVMQDE